jgi:hypothetical protein
MSVRDKIAGFAKSFRYGTDRENIGGMVSLPGGVRDERRDHCLAVVEVACHLH